MQSYLYEDISGRGGGKKSGLLFCGRPMVVYNHKNIFGGVK
jgi:hypothetical protein